MPDKEKLHALGIDADLGRSYCADDEEFYTEMLLEYANDGKEKEQFLRSSFEARDYSVYAMTAHSIKSTSMMIGAKELSRTAKEMELAAKAGDGAAVESGHLPFLNAYTATLEGLRRILT